MNKQNLYNIQNLQKGGYDKPSSIFYAEFTKRALSNLFMLEYPLIQELEKKLGSLKDKKGMDFGCGCGQLSDKLSQYGAKMIGVDISEGQLENTKRVFPNIQIEQNIDCLENSSLDFIICKFSLCEIDTDNYSNILNNFKNKLKKGGILIIGDHNRDICSNKETMCEKYEDITEKKPGDKVIAILKTPGTILNESSIEGRDYITVTDYYRPNERVKKSLKKSGAKGVEVILPKCPLNPIWVPLQERNNAIYRITIAQY